VRPTRAAAEGDAVTGGSERSRAAVDRVRGAPAWAIAVLLLSSCSVLGPPPMEPLSADAIGEAESRWRANGVESYHLVVRVRAPRLEAVVYDLVVVAGRPIAIERNGVAVRSEDANHHDYSVAGLFGMLRQDLHLADVRPTGNVPAIDLRARFEGETGRLLRYRRTVGAARRRVLLVEALRYEPLPDAAAASSG
jgi:hypothetical protein